MTRLESFDILSYYIQHIVTVVRDDPLEYRCDLTVTVEEVTQLLLHPDGETALCHATRASNLSRQQLNRSNPNLIRPAPAMLHIPHTSQPPLFPIHWWLPLQ